VRLCDIIDKFLNQHCLADTGTPEKANLAPTSVGSEEVYDLNTGLKNLGSCRLVDKRRGVSMDRLASNALDGPTLVNRFANDVHDTAQCVTTHGDLDGRPSINDLLTPNKTLGTVHSNSTDRVLAQVGSDLKDEATATEVLDFKGIKDRRQGISLKLDVDDSTDNRLDVTNNSLRLCRVRASCAENYVSESFGERTKEDKKGIVWDVTFKLMKQAYQRSTLQSA
jgi:hypothetical protein